MIGYSNNEKANENFAFQKIRLFIDKYLAIVFTIVLSLVFFAIAIFNFGKPLTESFLNVCRINASTNTKAAFAAVKEDKECFANLNGYIFLEYEKSRTMSADVFMPLDNVVYDNNFLGYKGTLTEEKTCLVSKNILNKHKLAVGDFLSVYDMDYQFKIVGTLPIQMGIDDRRNHEGIVVVSNTPDITKGKPKEYLTFYDQADTFWDLNHLVNIDQLLKENTYRFSMGILIFLAVIIGDIFICEIFLGKSRRHYYRSQLIDGVRQKKVFVLMLVESLLKYFLPLLLMSILGYIFYGIYQIYYFVPVAIFMVFSLLIILTYLLVFAKRKQEVSLWKRKQRQKQ